MAESLNEMLGLPAYVLGELRDENSELPYDEEELLADKEPELVADWPARRRSTVRRKEEGSRRDVGRHIAEVFAGLSIGTELTVGEIVRRGSSQYSPGEISSGAASNRIRANDVYGIHEVVGRPRNRHESCRTQRPNEHTRKCCDSSTDAGFPAWLTYGEWPPPREQHCCPHGGDATTVIQTASLRRTGATISTASGVVSGIQEVTAGGHRVALRLPERSGPFLARLRNDRRLPGTIPI
jgi:hypothetical protein